MRLGVALEVRAPRNHDAVAIERTITPSDPPTNLTALRRPKYRQNGKRLPGTEMRAIECACCENCAGNQGRVMEEGREDKTTGRREMEEHACMLQDATATSVCAHLRRRRMLWRVVL